VAIDGDDPRVFAALLRALYNHAASRGFGFALLGLSPRDPLVKVASSYRHVLYKSDLYLVSWGDSPDGLGRVDDRPPGPEAAVL
jgi:hypothetical protein